MQRFSTFRHHSIAEPNSRSRYARLRNNTLPQSQCMCRSLGIVEPTRRLGTRTPCPSQASGKLSLGNGCMSSKELFTQHRKGNNKVFQVIYRRKLSIGNSRMSSKELIHTALVG